MGSIKFENGSNIEVIPSTENNNTWRSKGYFISVDIANGSDRSDYKMGKSDVSKQATCHHE